MRPIHRHPFVEQVLPLMDEAAHSHHAKHAPAKPAPPPCQSMAHYQNQALSRIGGANQDIRQRNEKISGAYAALWMKNKDAFRWQGAAAHASGQVGLVMDLCDPRFQKRTAAMIPDRVFDPTPPFAPDPPMPPIGPFKPDNSLGPHPIGRMNKALVLKAVGPLDAAMRQALADGNIAIYESIYPTSLAYAHGGMAELNCMQKGMSRAQRKAFQPIHDAFADIDQGIALKNKGDKVGGEEMIRSGNKKLIHFEQDNVAQPIVFDKHPDLTWVMTPFAFGHFSGDPYHPDLATLSTYYPSHAPHSLGDATERDSWIINDIFPVWYKQYEQDPAQTVQRMQKILDRGRAAGGSY